MSELAAPPAPPPPPTPPAPMVTTPRVDTDGTPNSDKPNKRQKVAIACDVCRAKKVKCDSVRPICGPCSKRQHGAPCEYTTVTRTSHGPTKGYVHHLELKLRELQSQAGANPGLRDYLNEPNGTQTSGHITRSPPSQLPPPPSTSLSQNSSYTQQNSSNWGTPVQWQQRPSEEHPRQSLSNGPPSAQSAHDLPVNGTATPDGPVERRIEPDGSVNGRSSSFIHQHEEPSIAESTTERKDVLSRSPIDHSPLISTTIRKRPRSVDYILPSRKTADGLLETYWETAFGLFPILDYKIFNTAYHSIWSGSQVENESLLMCTLNVIFALAYCYTEPMDPKARAQSADKYFDRAQELFEIDLWNAESQSVESIQCLLLICQYLQSRSATKQSWTFINMAISIAESLGLHLPPPREITPRQRTMYQVLWHGCLYMKRKLAMQGKRPPMIDKLATTLVSKPFRTGTIELEAHFYHSLLLSEILDEILIQQQLAIHDYTRDQYGYLELTNESTLNSLCELDGKLNRWRSELPPSLLQTSIPHGPRSPHHRQANSIRLQYYNTRIHMFRPTLSRYVALQVNPQDPRHSESFQAQTALTCATLCLHSSLDMIEFIYTRLPSFEQQTQAPAQPPSTAGPNTSTNGTEATSSSTHGAGAPPSTSSLPPAHETLYYLHTSALVLLASRLARPLCNTVPSSTLEDAFNTALYCVREHAKSTGNVLATRSEKVLEQLARQTQRARWDIEHIAGQGIGVGALRVEDLDRGVRECAWVEWGLYEL